MHESKCEHRSLKLTFCRKVKAFLKVRKRIRNTVTVEFNSCMLERWLNPRKSFHIEIFFFWTAIPSQLKSFSVIWIILISLQEQPLGIKEDLINFHIWRGFFLAAEDDTGSVTYWHRMSVKLTSAWDSRNMEVGFRYGGVAGVGRKWLQAF